MKKTKPELRVEIAKDVLKHIKANKIKVQVMTYFEADNFKDYIGDQLQDALPKLKNCTVCALGGLFYSYIGRHNNYALNDKYGLDEYTMREEMTMFKKGQLLLIETAFEAQDVNSGQCARNSTYSPNTIKRAVTYRGKYDLLPRYENDDKALIHIMKNIIRNKGTFKP